MLEVNHWLLRHVISFILFLLTIIFVSLILRSKRPPGSTSAWLLFIALVPYVGIPFYVFFSFRKFGTKLTQKEALFSPPAKMGQNASRLSEPGKKPNDSIENLLQQLGNPPARSNQVAHLIVSGEEAYRKIMELIESATRTIHLTTFIFADDAVGRAILEKLILRARSGIEVLILLDSLGAAWVKSPRFGELIQAGGKVGYFMPLLHLPAHGRANLRNHRKILLIDSSSALLGGMNIASQYMGPSQSDVRWEDLAYEIRGQSALDVQMIFDKDWAFATYGKPRTQSLQPNEAPAPEKSHRVQIVASGPDVIGDSLYDSILTLIFQAKSRLWIATPYFIPDESLAKALELAAQRGIDVRILIPEKSNHFLADWARGSYIQQLASRGCQFYFFPRMMHAKALLMDSERALIASANFDMRSLLYNYEIGSFVEDPASLLEIEAWFSSILPKAHPPNSTVATRITHPPFWSELAQGIGRVLGPLI